MIKIPNIWIKNNNSKGIIVFLLAFSVFVTFTINVSQIFATTADDLIVDPNSDIYLYDGLYPPRGFYNTTFGSGSESHHALFWVGNVSPNGNLIDWYWDGNRLYGNYDVTTGKIIFEIPFFYDFESNQVFYRVHEGYFYKYVIPVGDNFRNEISIIDGVWNSFVGSGGWHSGVSYIKHN